MIRGLITNNQGQPIDKNGNPTTNRDEYQYKYKRMIYTRKDVRKKDSAPNILLTNPTMLEYILLRKSDENLIDPQKQSLRWVAIDETHTYTGAGAAELAMLLRRVMLAFGVDAQDVRFATSSATFVNNEDIQDPELREKKEEEARFQLQKFISDLTGTSIPQVKVIGGEREGKELLSTSTLPEEEKNIWKAICQADYIELDKLFKEGDIAEKLHKLDEICLHIDKLYAIDKETLGDNAKIMMKCKVHYFYRVPNNGIYVRLNESQDGAFKIYTQKPIEQEEDKLPLLELCRCKHCGEFLAVGMLDKKDHRLYPVESDDNDMFDLGVEEDNDSEIKQTVFALSKVPVHDNDHTGSYDIDGLQVMPSTAQTYRANEWHLIGNEYRECPCCRKKLTKYSSSKEKENSDAEDSVEDMRLLKLRLSAEFISRILAITTLDQLDVANSKNSITLHSGQQFMSFVDSRQAAAKSTMNQNLEQERLWFYTTIYHELCRRTLSKPSVEEAIATQQQIFNQATAARDNAAQTKAFQVIQNLQSHDESIVNEQLSELSNSPIMSWDEIADLFYKDENCMDDYFMVFCHQFIKRTEDSEDLDANGNIKEEAKLKYLYSIMVLYLANRPATAASPETMGLFRPYYTFLKDLKAPQSFKNLNSILRNEKVEDKDWQDLIQVFLDYTVRSNQSVFLRMNGSGKHIYDIFSCERYATEKPRRRPVKKPAYENPGDISDSRLVRFISGLISRDLGLADDNQTQRDYFSVIKPIIDDLWKTLEDNNILESGTHYDSEKDTTKQIPDRDDTAKRFNLAKMSFALYDDVYLCDTNTEGKINHVAKCRPIQENFMRFSPYLIGNRAVTLDESLHEKWDCYDAYKGCGNKYDVISLKAWAADKRSLLWKNGLWGEDGVLSDRLNNIHLVPNLFIQGEHTAQVDKMVARQLQAQFKDHSINILACSTTMEMGVDLGNLELVMLTSVPPLPANYKQRAGRSGRNNKVKSACVTLCGSDAIGLRTLHNPVETIIKRPVDVPTVDLDSQQVVMRHVISYLIRSFGAFSNGNNGGSLNQKVLDFYTPFKGLWDKNLRYHIYYDENYKEIDVDSGMGDPKGTNYQIFLDKCSDSMSPTMSKDMQTLLKDTPFISNPNEVLKIAKAENKRCYDELSNKVENLRTAKRNADPSSKGFNSYMRLLNMEYNEIMKQKLLNYWATNRFTPNANMPVNIMSLDLNATKLKSKKDKKHNVSNPSYTLRQAIQQYVPGNSLVVDGVVYIVRGLTTQDAYTNGRTIKQLFRNANKTVVGEDVTLDTPIPWDVNGRENLSLVQPVRFLPDPNEDYSRIMDDNIYTHVSAQLIGTKDWNNKVTEPNLFSTRRSSDSGDANILYYNEGSGHGYAMCIDCGKMCLESDKEDEGKAQIPRDIDDKQNKNGRYHFAIDREKKHRCFGSGKKDRIKRNVIIGDLMQTDYCEIRFRHKGDTSWIAFSPDEEKDRKNRNLLITMGITICQALVELKGWERGSVDFAVMQNRHLCIFDTNPGGAGYSIQLHDNQTMLDVIESAKSLLEKAKERDSKDMLLDKYTLRFIKYIDIDGALEWIEEQNMAKDIYPDPIPSVFNVDDVRQSSIRELINAFSASTKQSTLFVDDNFNKWDFGTPNSGWQGRLLGDFFVRRSNTTFCVARKNNAYMPEGVLQMLRDIKSFFGNPVSVQYISDKPIYPLAYIDGRLYFTINDDSSTLNEYWGDGVLYCIKTDNPADKAAEIDCSINEATTQLFFLDGETCEERRSNKIGELIHTFDPNAKKIIDKFLQHCSNTTDGELYVSYQDEHMKSVASIILILQTIEYFVRIIKKNFELEFLLEEYQYDRQKRGIFANLENSINRDNILDSMAITWLDDLYDDNIQGRLIEIESKDGGDLPHWRVLNLEFNGKRLSIYPDGGILNGWGLGKLQHREYYDVNTATCEDKIPLVRQKPIKYEVHIEDIE